jgi:hypothetical protein
MTTLNASRERSLLARAEPGVTPLERAAAHGLDLQAYLERVYGRPPAPLADEGVPLAQIDPRRLRAERIIQALAETPRPTCAAVARRFGCHHETVRAIRDGAAWPELPRPWLVEAAAPLTLRAALERRKAG